MNHWMNGRWGMGDIGWKMSSAVWRRRIRGAGPRKVVNGGSTDYGKNVARAASVGGDSGTVWLPYM